MLIPLNAHAMASDERWMELTSHPIGLFATILFVIVYMAVIGEVFSSLRSWLVHRSCSYRTLFWFTGILSLFLSPVIDNLTTALVMCAVVLTMLGMMTGLAYLQFFGFYLRKTHIEIPADRPDYGNIGDVVPSGQGCRPAFDVSGRIARSEWDTLLFFYGVVLCVCGLGFTGYLAQLSTYMYVDLGATTANILVGFLSAIIDNIPVMFAVLSMQTDMTLGEWLLVTLTAAVGGSMLSIGSAAGVALMGQARGQYTFFTHLKWTPVIMLGYAASIVTHMWINAGTCHLQILGG